MALFRKKIRQPGWTCIDVTATAVDVARVQPAREGKPEVLVCDSYRKEGSDRDVLARLRRALHLDDGNCTTLLAPGQYFIMQVDAPRVPAGEIKAALRWQIRDLVSFPVDKATVDAIPIPGSQRYLVVASPNDTIAAVMQLFDEAGIELCAIDIPELAQRNVARLLEEKGRALALLVFDNEDPLLTLTADGELYQCRRIELQSPGIAATDPQQRSAQFDRVALELMRSFDHFDRQHDALRIARLVVSGIAGADDLMHFLEGKLGVPVAALDLGAVMDCHRIPELGQVQRQTQCVHMLGGALREGAAA